jgi:hypothetical protein
MKRKNPARLSISKETLTRLEDRALGRLDGGQWPLTVPKDSLDTCNACTFSCGCSLGTC